MNIGNIQIHVSKTGLPVMFNVVDEVIGKYNRYGFEADKHVPTEIKSQSVLATLQSLKDRTYFCILDVESAAEAYGVSISYDHMRWLRSMHCVDYSLMGKETKEYLFAVLLNYFKPVILGYDGFEDVDTSLDVRELEEPKLTY